MATKANGRGRGWRKGVIKYSADEIENKVRDYFNQCSDRKRRPTMEGLAGYIDITTETLLIWMNADKEDSGEVYNPEVSEILKKARDYMSDELQQSNDSMSIFRLKQPRYGGYQDKQTLENNGNMRIEFILRGLD